MYNTQSLIIMSKEVTPVLAILVYEFYNATTKWQNAK